MTTPAEDIEQSERLLRYSNDHLVNKDRRDFFVAQAQVHTLLAIAKSLNKED